MDAQVPLLLVEDEPDLKDALEEYLGACGFAVTSAETAKEAFAAAERANPRIVLSDLSLPDGRGDVFLEEFHRKYPACLLYVHSGDTSFVPSPGLRTCGLTSDHVFAKPADLAVLVAKLHADAGS